MWARQWLITALWALTLACPATAFAASSIYHSGPENVYGWCAGYAPSRADRCAERNCEKQAGSACTFAVGCGGVGAVAFAVRPARGFAAACLGDERSARSAALIGCMSATNAPCWTGVTFTSRGRELDENSNRRFDQVWTAQLALQLLSFLKEPADGEFNDATIAAVGAFELAIGRLPTGSVDDAMLRRILDAVGGARYLATLVKRDQLPSLEKQLLGAEPRRLYSAALEPLAPETPNQYFKSLSGEELREALTTYIMSRGAACTTPSKAASELADSIWAVTCEEASYNVIFNDGGSIITGGGRTIIK